MRDSARPTHTISYDGLLDPRLIHASSLDLGWQGIVVNNDFLQAGFGLEAKHAFPDHHIAVNIGDNCGRFSFSGDGFSMSVAKVVRPWEFIFVPAGMKWDWNIQIDSRILSIRVQSEILNDVSLRAEFGGGKFGCKFPKIVEIAQALKDELESPNAFTAKAVEAHRTLLAITLAKQYAIPSQPAPKVSTSSEESGIAAAILLIERWVENPGGNPHPTLETLREVACMSDRSFSRHFESDTANPLKLTAISYMHRRAMDKAESMLRLGFLIKHVAATLGYEYHRFCEVFETIKHQPPGAFRPRG